VSDTRRLIDGFLRSASTRPDGVALVTDEGELTYSELHERARAIATTLDRESAGDLCAILGVATHSVFASILGTLISGRGYVPLKPAFPTARTSYMIEASGVNFIMVDANGEAALAKVAGDIARGTNVLLPHAEVDQLAELKNSYPHLRLLGKSDLSDGSDFTGSYRAEGDPAYLMFTSGSTGNPKGVLVAQRNVVSFVDTIVDMYEFSAEDRFSQMFDLTFDLSAYDMFVCWETGASLWVVPPKSRMAPAAFIKKSELTVWFSVPAVAGFMKQLYMLKQGNFPSLRYSLFCGEPLPAAVAAAWQEAAPKSELHNLYGPTELTIACASHHWDSISSPEKSLNGVVPIGRIYQGLECGIVDAGMSRVPTGEAGELCVRGPQTTPGYWQRPDLTEEQFVAMPWADDTDNRWYRTGDVVKELEDGEMVFIGRVDNQVKILGYRVELGEIEARLREHGETDFAIAVPWPVGPDGTGASGVVACLAGAKPDDQAIIDACKSSLPEYMVPTRIFRVEQMPLNVNGKIDRNALKALVEERSAGR
jgi:amino acid adenylation domain-containing protein